MPFESNAQRKWMWATHPAMAKRWQRDTPKGARLPEHVAAKQGSVPQEGQLPSEISLQPRSDVGKATAPTVSVSTPMPGWNPSLSPPIRGITAGVNFSAAPNPGIKQSSLCAPSAPGTASRSAPLLPFAALFEQAWSDSAPEKRAGVHSVGFTADAVPTLENTPGTPGMLPSSTQGSPGSSAAAAPSAASPTRTLAANDPQAVQAQRTGLSQLQAGNRQPQVQIQPPMPANSANAHGMVPGFKNPMAGAPNPLGAGTLAYGGARAPGSGKVASLVAAPLPDASGRAIGAGGLGTLQAEREQPDSEVPQLTASTPALSAPVTDPTATGMADSGAGNTKLAASVTVNRQGKMPHEGIYNGKLIKIRRPQTHVNGKFSTMGHAKAAMPSWMIPAGAAAGLGTIGAVGALRAPSGHRTEGAYRALSRTGHILGGAVPGAALGLIAGGNLGSQAWLPSPVGAAVTGAGLGALAGGAAGNAYWDWTMPQPTWERGLVGKPEGDPYLADLWSRMSDHDQARLHAEMMRAVDHPKHAHALTDAQRSHMPKKEFARPSKGKTESGSYPLPDKKHVAIALGFAKMHHDPAAAAAVRSKAKSLGLMGKAAELTPEQRQSLGRAALAGGTGLLGGAWLGHHAAGPVTEGPFRFLSRLAATAGGAVGGGMLGAPLGAAAGTALGGTPEAAQLGTFAGAGLGAGLGGGFSHRAWDWVMPEPTWERKKEEKTAGLESVLSNPDMIRRLAPAIIGGTETVADAGEQAINNPDHPWTSAERALVTGLTGTAGAALGGLAGEHYLGGPWGGVAGAAGGGVVGGLGGALLARHLIPDEKKDEKTAAEITWRRDPFEAPIPWQHTVRALHRAYAPLAEMGRESNKQVPSRAMCQKLYPCDCDDDGDRDDRTDSQNSDGLDKAAAGPVPTAAPKPPTSGLSAGISSPGMRQPAYLSNGLPRSTFSMEGFSQTPLGQKAQVESQKMQARMAAKPPQASFYGDRSVGTPTPNNLQQRVQMGAPVSQNEITQRTNQLMQRPAPAGSPADQQIAARNYSKIDGGHAAFQQQLAVMNAPMSPQDRAQAQQMVAQIHAPTNTPAAQPMLAAGPQRGRFGPTRPVATTGVSPLAASQPASPAAFTPDKMPNGLNAVAPARPRGPVGPPSSLAQQMPNGPAAFSPMTNMPNGMAAFMSLRPRGPVGPPDHLARMPNGFNAFQSPIQAIIDQTAYQTPMQLIQQGELGLRTQPGNELQRAFMASPFGNVVKSGAVMNNHPPRLGRGIPESAIPQHHSQLHPDVERPQPLSFLEHRRTAMHEPRAISVGDPTRKGRLQPMKVAGLEPGKLPVHSTGSAPQVKPPAVKVPTASSSVAAHPPAMVPPKPAPMGVPGMAGALPPFPNQPTLMNSPLINTQSSLPGPRSYYSGPAQSR